MGLRDGIGLLRHRWVTIAVTTMVALLAALLYVALSPTVYQARAKVFVSVPADPTSLDPATSINAGSQFVLGQMRSYAQLGDGAQVLQPVIDTLKLNDTVAGLARDTTVHNLAGTAVLVVTAHRSDALAAAQLANAVAASLATVIKKQQTGTGTNYLNAQVTTTASVPAAPVAPAQDLDLLIGLVAGLVGGLILAVGRERLDHTVRTAQQLRELVGEPLLATIPAVNNRASVPFAVLDDRASELINAYRSARVALALANRGTLPSRVIVASASAADGRSSFASNLAISTAETGARVCLVEADLESPTMAQRLDIGPRIGLAEVLAGSADLDDAIHDWHGLLSVLTIGAPEAAPDSGVTSPRIRHVLDELSNRYDMVVVDTAPLSLSVDALLIAQYASGGRHARAGQDGVVLVSRVGRTRPEDLTFIADAVRTGGAQVLGTALITIPAPAWQRPTGRPAAINSARSRLLAPLAAGQTAALPPGELSVLEIGRRSIDAQVPSDAEDLDEGPSEGEAAAGAHVVQAVSTARGTASALASSARRTGVSSGP